MTNDECPMTKQNMRPGGNRFDIRASSFFRHSSFGFGHCPEPPHLGCYDFMNDLKFAFRQLSKNPGFTAVAVLTLALGIGATTAIFSVVYAVVLRPLPFPESERLVAIWTQTPQVERLPMAPANHRDLHSQAAAFEDIALLSRVQNYNLTGLRQAEASADEPDRRPRSTSTAGATAGY